MRMRLVAISGSLALAAALLLSAAPAYGAPASINCEYSALCAEVADSASVFGADEYVGHDEPSLVFYSDVPGSGNSPSYSLRLPRDPSPNNPTKPGKSYQFELNGSFWFGMALCATESYPEQVSTCTPDSDSNILDPSASPNHAGTGFVELQFYPPGWVPWPTWQVAIGASACDPTKWCAAMNIFSLAEDPVAGTFLNSTCAAKTGIEYVNFAFITKNGRTTAPPNPVESTTATFTPDASRDLFMNSGDRLTVTMHDTPNGLQAVIEDLTTGQSGSMTASAANGFGQVQYDPTGTSCVNQPYDFHPMYSTSSPQTRVIWAAHTYNVGFSDEIGHFENCTGPNPIPATPFGVDAQGNPIACPTGNNEGFGANLSPTDGDDNFCFPASEALRIHIAGCTDTNTGFDSLDYQPVWPDGNRGLHPEPIRFSSPQIGSIGTLYSQVAFEANLPRLQGGVCRATGTGCNLIPITDKGTPAAFYPFFSTLGGQGQSTCEWAFGNDLPSASSDFGKNAQYGTVFGSNYLIFGGGGAAHELFNNFRQIITNPCRP